MGYGVVQIGGKVVMDFTLRKPVAHWGDGGLQEVRWGWERSVWR